MMKVLDYQQERPGGSRSSIGVSVVELDESGARRGQAWACLHAAVVEELQPRGDRPPPIGVAEHRRTDLVASRADHRITDIAATAGVTKQAVALVVNQLEGLGYV